MSTDRNVAILVGSLRKESFNRKLANALIALAPASLRMSIHDIGTLPLYNQDLETATPPAEWKVFRDGIRAADALLFVTPEYNRSVPGALKNAIDVGSRPVGHSVWGGKPGGVISVTQGALGAFGANHALRQSLVAVNVAAMAHPEMYIGNAAKHFDEKGHLIDASVRELLEKFLKAFAQWIDNNAPK
jgi:chromate reductase, NAD(P)H dehydrogenase (quinone)